mmetsp:Transcript_53922/g.174200  ORF Transcript_53922/g.174200 Transcript_53922/m.174200 type:complete len:282 (-) Transcript_53922:601-1446(-)
MPLLMSVVTPSSGRRMDAASNAPHGLHMSQVPERVDDWSSLQTTRLANGTPRLHLGIDTICRHLIANQISSHRSGFCRPGRPMAGRLCASKGHFSAPATKVADQLTALFILRNFQYFAADLNGSNYEQASQNMYFNKYWAAELDTGQEVVFSIGEIHEGISDFDIVPYVQHGELKFFVAARRHAQKKTASMGTVGGGSRGKMLRVNALAAGTMGAEASMVSGVTPSVHTTAAAPATLTRAARRRDEAQWAHSRRNAHAGHLSLAQIWERSTSWTSHSTSGD